MTSRTPPLTYGRPGQVFNDDTSEPDVITRDDFIAHHGNSDPVAIALIIEIIFQMNWLIFAKWIKRWSRWNFRAGGDGRPEFRWRKTASAHSIRTSARHSGWYWPHPWRGWRSNWWRVCLHRYKENILQPFPNQCRSQHTSHRPHGHNHVLRKSILHFSKQFFTNYCNLFHGYRQVIRVAMAVTELTPGTAKSSDPLTPESQHRVTRCRALLLHRYTASHHRHLHWCADQPPQHPSGKHSNQSIN